MGDLKYFASAQSGAGLTYDADDKVLIFASGVSLFNAVTGAPLASLPSNDSSTIFAVAYISSLRSIYFASPHTLYSMKIGGTPAIVAQGLSEVFSIAADGAGAIYVIDNDHISKISGQSAVPLTAPGSITNPSTSTNATAIALPQLVYNNRDGALYATNPVQDQVMRVTTGGAIGTFAGSCVSYSVGGPKSCWPGNREGSGSGVLFGDPDGIAYDSANGLLYLSDASNNELWTIDANANAKIVAGYGAPAFVTGNGLLAFMDDPINLAYGSDNGAVYLGQQQIGGPYAIASYATTGAPPPAYTPATQKFLTPSVPSQPQDLALAPDGSAWIAESFASKIGHVTASGVTEFPLVQNLRQPQKIVVDGGGNAWASATQIGSGDAVVRVTPAGSENAYFATPQPGGMAQIDSVAIGPDANLWFSERDVNGTSVGTVNGSGTVTQYWISTQFNSPSVRAMAAGPGGDLWLATGYRASQLSTATPIVERMTTSGNLDGSFNTARSGISLVYNQTDGNLWFVDGNNYVSKITPSGSETDFPLSQCGGCFTAPVHLAVAPDGAIWFTEQNYQDVARMDSAGNVTRYILPQSYPGPTGIAVRSDGKVWVTCNFGTVFLLDPAAYDAQNLPHPPPT